MVNIMLLMLVGVQLLMVYPPLRGFSPVIIGCIIPVLYHLFGIPNTCSYLWEVRLPHVFLFSFWRLVLLTHYDVRVTVRPLLIGCYSDIMRGKHLPHISCKLTQFTSLLGSAHLKILPTILPSESRRGCINTPLIHSFLHSSFSEKSRSSELGPVNVQVTVRIAYTLRRIGSFHCSS